jgi:aldehyde:ferredoxin oxidoreductase
MMRNHSGYASNIAMIDLTRRKIVVKDLDKALARNYIGGNGFCARFLFDLIRPGTNPLGPANVLVFAVGPLSGTFWPQTGKYEVAAKSPLTEIYGEANSGGHWGAELKHAGFDALIIRGRASQPIYVYIEDRHIEIKNAKRLWGRTTSDTDAMLKDTHGRDTQAVYIGPAGENQVRFACMMTDLYRAAARTGLGAVMGSKRLKAIAVRGSLDIQVADPDRFAKSAEAAYKKLLSHPFASSTTRYGTTLLVEAMSEIGRFPTRNFQTGVFERAAEIGGERIVSRYKLKDRACFACPYRCKNYNQVAAGRFAASGEGPEYETLSSLGGRCGNSDLESIIYANKLCNLYGLDTISCGGVIGFAMECYERGLLTSAKTGGLELRWGDPEVIITCIEKLTKREGFGNRLAEGTTRFAKALGSKAMKYAMHVKGLDISAQDGRAQKSMGLSHATANRGADHLSSFEVLSEVGFSEAIEERFGKSVMPEAADRLNPKYKALMVRDGENFCAIVDSLVTCKFGAVWPPSLYFAEFAAALTAVTGVKYTERELRLIGERIFTLERAFNIREGITVKDDKLPERFTTEPAPAGPCKGHVVELDYMLHQYYKLRGWDPKTGWVPRKLLVRLGLEDVANQLAKLKKLPG